MYKYYDYFLGNEHFPDSSVICFGPEFRERSKDCGCLKLLTCAADTV